MVISKKRIEWEEIDIKELLPPPSEYPEDERLNIFESIIEKYTERHQTLRILHTNFNLSRTILKKIAAVDGVELLLPIGRYRAVVMFGKLFDGDFVKKEVLLKINKFLYPKHLRSKDEDEMEDGVE